jgi:hypothetical protein
MDLMVQNFPIEVFIRLDDDPVEETLYDFLLSVYGNDADFSPLPFVLVFEFGQGNIKPVFEAVLDFIESLSLFLQ